MRLAVRFIVIAMAAAILWLRMHKILTTICEFMRSG